MNVILASVALFGTLFAVDVAQAGSSPSCQDTPIIRSIMEAAQNALPRLRGGHGAAGGEVVDIRDVRTEAFYIGPREPYAVCHASVRIADGAWVAVRYEIRRNSLGEYISQTTVER